MEFLISAAGATTAEVPLWYLTIESSQATSLRLTSTADPNSHKAAYPIDQKTNTAFSKRHAGLCSFFAQKYIRSSLRCHNKTKRQYRNTVIWLACRSDDILSPLELPFCHQKPTMIDPLTTLGLISNVLQVADFSIRILAKTDEIARSADGAIEENRDLERCATELILRNQNLSESLVRNDGEKDGWDKDDVILTRLGHDCNTVARELIECLSDLRSYRGRSTFKSIRQAIKTLYSREKVETISKRMKEFQDEMNGALLQSIRCARHFCLIFLRVVCIR